MTEGRYPRATKKEIRRYARLQMKKYRDEEGLFLGEGLRTVLELLSHLPDERFLDALFVAEDQLKNLSLHETMYREKVRLIGPSEGDRLSGTVTAQGVIGIFRQNERTVPISDAKKVLVVALDNVQDPGNVGTIIRTSAWFGASSVVCGSGTADRYNPKAVRASAGSLYSLSHYQADDLCRELVSLQENGFTVYSSSLRGRDLRTCDTSLEKTVLVIGNEANGVSREIASIADCQVSIPRGTGGNNSVESLNAAVSAGILLASLSL